MQAITVKDLGIAVGSESIGMNDQKIDVNRLAEIDCMDSEVYLKIRAEMPT